jgi:hypothetical protein
MGDSFVGAHLCKTWTRRDVVAFPEIREKRREVPDAAGNPAPRRRFVGTRVVKVQVYTSDSEVGRTGGGVMNMSAKSGGSEFRGSAYL